MKKKLHPDHFFSLWRKKEKVLLIMKITFLFIFICSLQVSASVYSQSTTLDLSLKNTTVRNVLKMIESKTDLRFFYNDEFAELNRKVSIEATQKRVDEILNEVFNNANVTYKLMNDNVIVILPLSEARERKVTGTVKDGLDGTPIPGVNLLIKGTTQGTVTDYNGNYAITVPDDNAILVFSFIGYTTEEVVVGNRSVVDISLIADIKQLSEVVIVGYGEQKKSDVTGSIAVIDEKSIRQIPAGNIATALQGMGAGIGIQKDGGNSHPGSTPVIRIRGERSLSGGNDPLIILDGIPYDGSLNDISPDDIVSVQVLKDASSTAIYGSRGSNGVILINTLRGKEQKPTLTYNGYTGFNKPLGKYDLMNAEEFVQFKKRAKFNGSPEGTYTGLDDPQLVIDMFTDPTEYAGYQKGTDTDWQDLMYKTSILTNHQLSLTGGVEKTQYAASVGYYNSTGTYEKQSMERYTLKLSVDHKIGNYVKVGLNTLNSYTTLSGLDVNPMSQALQASPLLSPYKDDGTLVNFLGASQTIYNPLKDFEEGAILDDKNRLSTFTTGYLDIDFTHGFKYKLNAGIQLNPETHEKFYASETTKQSGGRNWGNNLSIKGYNYTIENILTYDKTVAEKHHFNFTGLYSIQEKESQMFSTAYNDVIADFIGYYNPSLASNHTSDGEYKKWDMISYMGRLNYNFSDRYLLTLTVRSDGSSRLAKGNKWQTFPSGAIGWNISNESFMSNIDFISSLKLRASYGTVGSTAVNEYQTLGRLSGNKYNYGSENVLAYYPTDASNHTLSWEETTTFNVGLDYGFLNNRLSGAVEYYIQETTNLLMDQALPATSGIKNKIKTNVGETENKGFEFSIRSVNADGNGVEALQWTTNFNIYLNRQSIKKLASGATEDKANNWFVGYPNGVYYNYKRIGIWQNTPEDIELAKQYGLTTSGSGSVIGAIKVADLSGPEGVPDGKIDDKDRIILGYRQPDFEGGMTNTFAFKNFDLSVVMNFKVGGMMKSDMHDGWMNTFQAGYNNLDVRYWTTDNNENYWPKPNSSQQNPQYKSTLTYMDASYLKIRTITLGYQIPKTVLNRAGIQSARIYSTASNPFVFFSEYVNKFGGLDPETNQNVSLNTPAMWSMLFGVNLTF